MSGENNLFTEQRGVSSRSPITYVPFFPILCSSPTSAPSALVLELPNLPTPSFQPPCVLKVFPSNPKEFTFSSFLSLENLTQMGQCHGHENVIHRKGDTSNLMGEEEEVL